MRQIMAKSEHKNADNNWTGQWCIDLGRRDYKRAIGMEENEDPNQKAIDAAWGSSVKYFFYSFVLGHKEAPLCLAASFNQGTGVKEDKYMAALLYGVALELKDLKCSAVAEAMPAIPKFMKPAISAIAKLIKETQAKIPAEGLNSEKFFKQAIAFEEKVALITGKLMVALFISEETAKQSITQFAEEHPDWLYHDAQYYQHLMDAAAYGGGGAAAGGADSHLSAAFSDLHH